MTDFTEITAMFATFGNNKSIMIKRTRMEVKYLIDSGFIVRAECSNIQSSDIKTKNEQQITLFIEFGDKKIIVIIPHFYPFGGPEIYFNSDKTDLTSILLSNYYKRNTFGTKLHEELQMLMLRCDFDIPSYNLSDGYSLLIGSHPNENKYDRTFYSCPNLFLMDNSEDFEPTDQFIKLDFRNLKELQQFSQQNEEKFTTICFDWSVWKFFMNHGDVTSNDIERLNCFHKILKPNGLLIIPTSLCPSIIVYPLGKGPLDYSEEQRQQLMCNVTNEYQERLCKLFINSNFKFKLMKYDSIDNELFKIAPLSHPRYDEKKYHDNITISNAYNYVIVAMK